MAQTQEERAAYYRKWRADRKAKKAAEQASSVATLEPPKHIAVNANGEVTTVAEPTAFVVVDGDPLPRTKDAIEKLSAQELASIQDPDRKMPLHGGDYNLVLTFKRFGPDGKFPGLWELKSLLVKDGVVVKEKTIMDGSTKQSILGIAYNLIAYPKW